MSRLILVCLFAAVFAGQIPAQLLAANGFGKPAAEGLVWPEIRDPKDLLEFARERFGDEGRPPGGRKFASDAADDPRVKYLEPREFVPREQFVVILLSTHPFKGQGIMVILAPEKFQMPRWLQFAGDTSHPQFKRVLVQLPPGGDWFFGVSGVRVQLTRVVFEGDGNGTAPVPLVIPLPDYPPEMVRIGVSGEVKLAFTVMPDGTVTTVEAKGTVEELAEAVRLMAPRWRFEPSVDRISRLPVPSRVKLVVGFELVEE